MAPSTRILSVLLALGLAVGCESEPDGGSLVGGGGGGGGTGGGGPSGSQRTELALAVEDELEAAEVAGTLLGPGEPPGFTKVNCPTASISLDTDNDTIPNDQTLTFTNPPCDSVGFRGGSFAVTGTVRIQDSTSADTTSYRLTFTNLAWAATDSVGGSRSFTATRNGTRSRTATDTSVTLNSTINIARQRPARADATIDLTSLTTLVADTPGTVFLGRFLPIGKLTVTGTLHWKRSTEDWTLTVDTPTPMVLDPTCTTTPQRLSSGKLTLTGVVAGASGVLTLTFTGCGADPTATWVAGP